jgi:6-pyruvoyltetrahydropterin/6-carboxytetrahydropterin synthase
MGMVETRSGESLRCVTRRFFNNECVQRNVVTRFDLENLNMQQEFASSVPTTENLCTLIYDILKREFRQAHLEGVRLEETMMNSFEYRGS